MNTALLVFVVLFASAFSQTCTYTATDKSQYDLTAMSAPAAAPYSDQDTSGNTYFLNICAQAQPPGNTCGQDTAVCQQGTNGAWYLCGTLSSMALSDGDKGPATGVTVDYDNGRLCGTTPRSTTVFVECRPNAPTAITSTVESSGSCHYSLYMESGVACPKAGTGSGGSDSVGGVVFIGIVFGGLFLYFAIGSLYNWKVRGHSGTEIIPQSSFWLGLPGLCKDGAMFLKDRIFGAVGK